MDKLQLNDLSLDPCELSKEWLVVGMFLQSSSPKYKEAVSLAGSASFFKQLLIEGRQINVVGFNKTQKDISKFMTLQGLVYNWKGTRFFAGGRPLVNPYSCNETLNCYLLSLSCRNYEAYCWKIIDHPFYRSAGFSITIAPKGTLSEEQKRGPRPNPVLLVPCKRLEAYRLSQHHPASIPDLIQAMAVELNIDWCPNFKPDETKEIER